MSIPISSIKDGIVSGYFFEPGMCFLAEKKRFNAEGTHTNNTRLSAENTPLSNAVDGKALYRRSLKMI